MSTHQLNYTLKTDENTDKSFASSEVEGGAHTQAAFLSLSLLLLSFPDLPGPPTDLLFRPVFSSGTYFQLRFSVLR